MRLAAGGALCAALLTLMLATAAHANTRQETLVQDDRTLLFSGPAVRDRALDQISGLGADGIHSLVFWGRIAPSANSRHKPRFNAANPADYPSQAWDVYDDLVRGARARGLKLLFTPTGAMPAWASRCHGRISLLEDCRPSPHQFGMFIAALAKRYSGRYRDENQGGELLPRVSRWSVWNEPNQGGWLKPQYTRRHGRLVPAAPSIYRGLVRAAVHALRAHGHKHDQVLLGETAPIGRTTGRPLTRPISPVPFYRDLFCIDSHGRALRGRGAWRVSGCRHFHRLRVTGVAHHPYTRGAYQTPRNRGRRAWVTLSSVSRLERVLDQAAHHRRIRHAAPIWYTELGYQTRPPDPYGVSLRRQAAYINESNWLAYRTHRVRSIAQYELFDEPDRGVFNTGLRFAGGRNKPSLRAFRTPLWVTGSHHRVVVFGQVRRGARGQVVRIEFRRRGHHYTTLARVRLHNPRGYFVRHFMPRHGYWRLAWTSARGHTVHSRTARR
jgi:hypothetical protein